VKKQGGIVWMALAMMVKTRLWLGGEVSEQRDMALIRRLIERVRRCAAHRPLLVCTDGWVSYIRAMRDTFRDPVYTGKGGRPRLRPWRHIFIAQVVKRYERRRVVATDRRSVDGTPARVETLRRRSQGGGMINTAYIERLHATFREHLAPLARRCRALARQTLTLHEGMVVVGTVYNFWTPHESLHAGRCYNLARKLLVSSTFTKGYLHAAHFLNDYCRHHRRCHCSIDHAWLPTPRHSHDRRAWHCRFDRWRTHCAHLQQTSL
jgi:IS1 family transposase